VSVTSVPVRPSHAPRVLILVYDDTTVFMGRAFVEECVARGLDYETALISCLDPRGPDPKRRRPHVSDRQLAMLTNVSERSTTVADDHLAEHCLSFDVVLLTKLPPLAVRSLQRGLGRSRRPVLVGFSSGLDASPYQTLTNRAYVDLLLANSPHHLRLLQSTGPVFWSDRPALGVGHPFFARRRHANLPIWSEVRDVFFLHQSVWPSLPDTRHAVCEFLVELAERYPEKRIFLKLRHLPTENKDNVNLELHAPHEYFAARAKPLPPNLCIDTSSFRETLGRSDLYLSVSSSGIVEGWVHGVPGLFVEGFPGENHDALSRAIVDDFRSTGLVVSRDALLRGELPVIAEAALAPHFCSVGYFDELLARVEELRRGPVELARLHRLPLHLRIKKGLGEFVRRLASNGRGI